MADEHILVPSLETVTSPVCFWADIGLRPGKLAPKDAETMRRYRQSLEDGRDGLLAVAEKLAPHFPTEAAEMKRYAAQMLHAASWIWQLQPAPTPNTRDAINKQRGRGAGQGRKMQPARVAVDQAFDAALPANWNGNGAYKLSVVMHADMQGQLKRKNIPCPEQPAIYARLRRLRAKL